jgi:2-polyprenyl-3-methyl-5-hydroxy-6-metoxy-1,4-benzoquinol methylase
MTFVYDLTIDPKAENNPHAFALEMIGYNKSVLEVGSATGYFTKVLVERGCKVVGMEIDPGAGKQAEEFAERMVIGNVDHEEIWDQVDDDAFDVITFGDVLEHLQDPLSTLRIAKRKLKANGFIVTSLPNVAHGDVRLSLLHGSFPYSETGLLDRTHIRFFTLQSIREMMWEAGLVAVDTRRVLMPIFQSELHLDKDDFPDEVVREVRADPESETYQYVMKFVIDNGSQAVTELASRVDELIDTNYVLARENRELQEQIAAYIGMESRHADMHKEYERITSEMGTFVNHIQDLTRQVYALRDDVSAKAEHIAELEGSMASLSTALEQSQQTYAESERQYYLIKNSRSYRLTAPLRKVGAR